MHTYPYPNPPPPPSPPAPPLPYTSISTLILVYAILSYAVTYFIHRYEERTSLDMRNRSLGLSLIDLQALPWFQCEGDSGISCVICLESFQKADRCRCLPVCNHTFHARCIDLWLIQRLSCPTCRSPFVISSGFEAV